MAAPQETVKLKQPLMQSRHWDALTPTPGQTSNMVDAHVSMNWKGVLLYGIPVCDDGVTHPLPKYVATEEGEVMLDN